MCGKAKHHNNIIIPGTSIEFRTSSGLITGKWGISDGLVYNARSEKLNTTWANWSNKNRGILTLDSFFERSKEFVNNNSNLLVPIIFNNINEFAIITRDATDIVKPFHHRQPIILNSNNIEDWLNDNKIVEMNYNNLKIAA